MHPKKIERFEIQGLLGQGGMGKVYLGYDPEINRQVAIKTVVVQEARQRARFQQEVQAAGQLLHSHIVTIFNVGFLEDLAYIVMEYIDGGTLASHLSMQVPWQEAIAFLLPICEALGYAHERGVVHRDVKPANILLASDGITKLADFGVARLEVDHRLTTSGNIMGTALYIAPEQLEGSTIDGRADLFSLGITLFELITGQHPFGGETFTQIVYQLSRPDPIDLTPLTGLVPDQLTQIIAQALAKEPQDRFADAQTMSAGLDDCLNERKIVAAGFRVTTTASTELDYVVGDLSLSSTEEALLQQAFAGHDKVYLEREFNSGYSGARVILAVPVRRGLRLNKIVLKLDQPVAIAQEWQAYQSLVANILPSTAARIAQPPVYDETAGLGVLWYTFVGILDQVAPESLGAYYARHTGMETATLLNKAVFDVFGPQWWHHSQTDTFILRREYDRLLPVHLVVEVLQSPQQSLSEPPEPLIPSQVNNYYCRQRQIGDFVELQNFVIAELDPSQGAMTLHTPPPSGTTTNPIRIRIKNFNRILPPDDPVCRVGNTLPKLAGRIIATRYDLLLTSAQTAWPDQDLTKEKIVIAGADYPNPIADYPALLDRLITGMQSPIHGDLNLENILVTPQPELAWLINFATTRNGHTLADFLRLETQVITKLLPVTAVELADMVAIMIALHQEQSLPSDLAPAFADAFTVLSTIRQAAKVGLNDRQGWHEYYPGLVITLLGTLKFKELTPKTRKLVLVAAAVARKLIDAPEIIDRPVNAMVPQSLPAKSSRKPISWLILLIFIVGGGLSIWFWPQLSSSFGVFKPPLPTQTTSRTLVSGVLPPERLPSATATNAETFTSSPTTSPTASPTPLPSPTDTQTPMHTTTPTYTSTPTPTLATQSEGVVSEALDIYGGPGFSYPIIGTVANGTPVQVVGRSIDGEWWQIAHPSGPGGFAWLVAKSVIFKQNFNPPTALASPPPTVTNTPTHTPTFTITPTPTATWTATPTPYVDTGFRPHALFEAAWNTLGQGDGILGYPWSVAITDRNYARQFFERGFMFWWEASGETQPIWVVHWPDGTARGDTWREYSDAWTQNLPVFPPNCPEATEPLGPKSGFGITWCDQPGVKALVGFPTTAEAGSGNIRPKAAIQFFQNGIIFENPDERQIWVLVNEGGWYRFNY